MPSYFYENNKLLRDFLSYSPQIGKRGAWTALPIRLKEGEQVLAAL